MNLELHHVPLGEVPKVVTTEEVLSSLHLHCFHQLLDVHVFLTDHHVGVLLFLVVVQLRQNGIHLESKCDLHTCVEDYDLFVH